MSSLNNVQTLRCLHCMKEIQSSPVDPGQMLIHIQQDHPEIFAVAKEKMKHLHEMVSKKGLLKNSKETVLSETQLTKAAVQYLIKKNQNVVSDGACADNEASTASDPVASNREKISCHRPHADQEKMSRRQSFRLSITHWAPADGCIFCPGCGFSQRPLIKTASELTAKGAVANCIFTCWPLCCLPFLESREYLYCSNCRAFLGIYDRERNCVRPSREFVASDKEKATTLTTTHSV